MKEERNVMLGGLGYFSNQNLYLNLTGILNCYNLYTVLDSEDIDEDQMLAVCKELVDMAIMSKNQIATLLKDIPSLHKDDVAFFQKLTRGYTILIQMGELLYKFLSVYLNGDEDDIEADYNELKSKSVVEILKILGYQV